MIDFRERLGMTFIPINSPKKDQEDQPLPKFELHQKSFGQWTTILVLVNIDDFTNFQIQHELLVGFTDQELGLCRSSPKGVHSLAARYAAKRGAEFLTKIPWQCFEIIREPDTQPKLCIRDIKGGISRFLNDQASQEIELNADKKVFNNLFSLNNPQSSIWPTPKLLLSLTHDSPYAAAYVTLLEDD